MAFVGDVYVSDRLYDRYMEQEDVTGFMDQTVATNFRDVDIMVANHEYACTDLSDAHRDTRQLFNFKSPTSREYIWQELGVDVLSLANNHAMDFGEQSLFDTLDTLEDLDIPAIGAGRNLEDAKEAEIFEMQGKKVALLASSRFIVDADWYATTNSPGVLTTYESTPYFGIVKDEITRLKEEEGCDFVAIYVHFGKEKTNQIIESQVDIAHGYIDAGADLVMGAHAHTLQGIEFYKEKPIYYNLGNFLFSSKAVDTMLVNIEIHEDNSCSTSILPCLSSDFYVKAVEGEEKQRILSYVEDISVNAVIDADGNVREK